jgi:hypothetical protein
MKYQLWILCEYTEVEPMQPLNLIQESTDFNELFQIYKKNIETGGIYCICDNKGKIIIDGSKFIYERDEEKIYRRRFGMYSKKELI